MVYGRDCGHHGCDRGCGHHGCDRGCGRGHEFRDYDRDHVQDVCHLHY